MVLSTCSPPKITTNICLVKILHDYMHVDNELHHPKRSNSWLWSVTSIYGQKETTRDEYPTRIVEVLNHLTVSETLHDIWNWRICPENRANDAQNSYCRTRHNLITSKGKSCINKERQTNTYSEMDRKTCAYKGFGFPGGVHEERNSTGKNALYMQRMKCL